MSKTFRSWNPDQSILFPPSVLDLVPPGHLAHFVRQHTSRMNKVRTAVTLLVMGITSITLPGCASDAMKRSSEASQLISLYYSHGVEAPVDSVLEVQEDGWARFVDSGGATYSFRVGDAEMKLLRTEVTNDRFTGELSQQYSKSWADAAELEVRTAHVRG